MLIELQPPFSEKWKSGYLRVNSDGRKVIDLVNCKQQRTTFTYARYLMSVYLGYFVPDHFEVDHVNDDKTDDRIENLQLLTQEQNRYKQFLNKQLELETWFVVCANCSNFFLMKGREYRYNKSIGRDNLFCSRSCSGTFYSRSIEPRSKSQDVIDKIKQLKSEGCSSYKISDELSISRNTVMKYW